MLLPSNRIILTNHIPWLYLDFKKLLCYPHYLPKYQSTRRILDSIYQLTVLGRIKHLKNKTVTVKHSKNFNFSICIFHHHHHHHSSSEDRSVGFFFLDTTKCLLHADFFTAIFQISVASRAFSPGRR